MKITVGELRYTIREELSRSANEQLDERLRDAAIGLGMGALAAVGGYGMSQGDRLPDTMQVAAKSRRPTGKMTMRDVAEMQLDMIRNAIQATDEETAGDILSVLWAKYPRLERKMTSGPYAELDAKGKLDQLCTYDPQSCKSYLRVRSNGDLAVK